MVAINVTTFSFAAVFGRCLLARNTVRQAKGARRALPAETRQIEAEEPAHPRPIPESKGASDAASSRSAYRVFGSSKRPLPLPLEASARATPTRRDAQPSPRFRVLLVTTSESSCKAPPRLLDRVGHPGQQQAPLLTTLPLSGCIRRSSPCSSRPRSHLWLRSLEGPVQLRRVLTSGTSRPP